MINPIDNIYNEIMHLIITSLYSTLIVADFVAFLITFSLSKLQLRHIVSNHNNLKNRILNQFLKENLSYKSFAISLSSDL